MTRQIAALVVAVGFGCGSRHAAPPGLPAPAAVAVGDLPVDVVAGDLDGDGTLDLVTANGDRTISVRLRRDDRWIAPPGDPLAVDIQPHLIAVIDLDDDRDRDLVATGHDSGAVAAWLGDGAGRFRPAPGSPFVAFDVARPHNHGGRSATSMPTAMPTSSWSTRTGVRRWC